MIANFCMVKWICFELLANMTLSIRCWNLATWSKLSFSLNLIISLKKHKRLKSKQELHSFILHSSFFILHSSFFILHSSFFILHSSFFILHSSFFILHSSFFILHSSFFILHSSFFILHSSFFILHSSFLAMSKNIVDENTENKIMAIVESKI